MPSIALVGEGLSDQVVLENILIGIFDNPDLTVRMEQPSWDATDADRLSGAGGWTEVFRFCSSELFANAFAVNEFVVVQIDTDCCGEVGFDVPIPQTGNSVDVERLIIDVSNRICEVIDPKVLEQVRKRIIFAVCVDSIECWLLPLLYDQKTRAGKITGCLEAVNVALNKRDEGFYLHSKDPKYYSSVSSPFRKPKIIKKVLNRNPSLGIFIQSVLEVTNR